MTNSRLKKVLIEYNKKTVTFPIDNIVSEGTYKIVRSGKQFVSLSAESKDDAKKMPELDLAYSTLHLAHKQTELINSTQKAQALLLKKSVPTDFIMSYLYDSSYGDQVSLLAKEDLFGYTNRCENQCGIALVRNLIGQLCLAIYDLHSHGLVHRDIKTENILLYPFKGSFILKLTDLDDILEIDSFGKGVGKFFHKGTQQLLSPEFVNTLGNFRSLFQLKLKPVDCFALGTTLIEIFLLLKKTTPTLANDLSCKLIEENPKLRYTIEQALESPFFGKTKKARQKFFIGLRKMAQDFSLKSGISAIGRPKLDDASLFILDTSIKKLYCTAFAFAEKIQEAPKVFTSGNGYSELLAKITFTAWLQKEAEKLKQLAELQSDKDLNESIRAATDFDFTIFKRTIAPTNFQRETPTTLLIKP